MKSQSEIVEALRILSESLANSNMKISITIEPNNGLTGSQVEQARQKGRAGENIYFTNTDTTL